MFSIDGYTSLGVIHHGTRHTVVRALRLKDQRSVIIKMLAGEYPSQRELARLRHEFDLTKRAAADHVVRVCELRERGNGLALVLEDIGGEAMSELFADQRMDLDTFFEVAMQLTGALGEVHEHQIIHKDINPSNVVLNQQTGELRVIDFGIASLLSREDQQVGNPGMLEGTLAYISPEQTGRMNRAIDWRTDFYSLGVTFYQMLTGRLPFDSSDPMELVHCHIARTPLPPHEVDPGLPPMLSRVVLKLLAKTAEERYGTARGLAADLEECRRQWRDGRAIALFVPGTHDRGDRFQIPQKLYGRTAEVAALMNAFERVSDGATELMLVRGSAGIGKSALINEIHKPVVARRGYFVSGKCDQLQRNVPFGPVIMAMNELVRQLLTESDERLAAWREHLLQALGPNGQVVADVIPGLPLIVGPQPPVPELPPGPSQNRFNLVFQQFIRVFASAEHPLVISLDDLQWSDSASLVLLEVLLTDLETRWLLLIGAYRDSEMGPDHALRVTLGKLTARATFLSDISLGSLDLPTVTELVCDTVGCDRDVGGPLAELVLRKTEGTPFFVNEFLKALHEDGHLRFEPGRGEWTWDLEGLRSLQMTDNVVDLMTDKLRKLPARTRAVVELAACIGAEFDVAMLSLVDGQNPVALAQPLWELLQAGFILPIGTEYREVFAHGAAGNDDASGGSEKARFRFVHDRVQQAAYSLIDPAQRPQTHLRIGRLLLAATEREDVGNVELSFDVVDHLNRGRDLIDDRGEQDRLLALDLAAARKAKAATAFGPALAYATAGIGLIDEERWRRDPERCFRLHIEAAECAYLVGDYERMDELCGVALGRARSPLEQVEVHEVRIKACMARNELKEAVQTARDALLLLGVRLPRKPSKAHVLPGLAHAMWLIGRKHTADLASLPEMTDPIQLAIMRILTTVAQPVYYAAPDLLPVILLRMVVISLRYGNTPLAPYAWMSYAHIINLVFGKARVALRYGEFSRELLERYGATEYRAKIEFMFNAFVRHWTAHWRETLQPLVSAYQYGLQTGDLEYGATAIHVYCYHLLSVGKELAFVEAEMARHNAAIVAMKQMRSENNARLRHQVVLNLIGGAAQPWRLAGTQFNEDQALPEMERVQDHTALSQFHMYRALLSYLFGQTADAVEHIERAVVYAEGLNGMILQVIFRQYQALILLEAAGQPDTASRLRRAYARKAATARRDLAKWARLAPMNHAHRVHLIDAERAALHGRDLEAIAHYDQAIAAARENEYLADEALALERAAHFHLARGRVRIARGYVRDARHTWLRWGAGAKVAHLDALHPELFLGGDDRDGAKPSTLHATQGTPATIDDAGRSVGDRLELSTVMKASQAIAGEIILPRLLERLMRLAIENAGAEKGFLVFETDGRLCIEAEGSLDSNVVPVLRAVPIDTAPGEEPRLPSSIVKYVARTLEAVVLNDASLPGPFSRDPYVVARRPRSVLCAPLLDQGKLSAVIYLENNLTTAAFTPARLEMLQMLSAQAAISIDNARLYAAQLRLTEAQSRFVPGEFLHSLNRETIVDVTLGDNVRKEMTVLFSDIRGFTGLVENMSPADHIGFINSYLSYMEPAILANGGFVDSYIGDAIMALFDGGADRAVQAGIDMSRNLAQLNAERTQRGEPPIQMGVGVNTGTLTLGTIGGPMHIKCSVIGDSVNLAARIESLTKTYGAAQLISHHTRVRLADPDRYAMRQIARVTVMGKSVPVTLYEVLDAEAAPRRAAKLATLAAFEQGVDAYYRADFAAARRQFAACVEANEQDVAARIYLTRCEQYAKGVPDGWDGVEVLDYK